MIENTKLKANESALAQLTLQKKNLEILIVDLEKSMVEKETKIEELQKRNADFGTKISEIELANSNNQAELTKMVY